MSAIKGMNVSLAVAFALKASSKDALFLGVYGLQGGREFRLNETTPINQIGKTFELVLGDPCCGKAGTQVNLSAPKTGVPKNDNDPLLLPLDLASVQYVYLRKETDDTSPNQDDWLQLTSATVLLCDTSGNLRRFRQTGEINFSDQTGLQHWLRETDPPKCRVTVTLLSIEHDALTDNIFGNPKPAGAEWNFSFGVVPSSSAQFPYNVINHVAPNQNDVSNGEWTSSFGNAVTMDFPGCCGQKIKFDANGFAVDHDRVSPDEGASFASFSVSCSKEGNSYEQELKLLVKDKQPPFGESEITFHYTITAQCID